MKLTNKSQKQKQITGKDLQKDTKWNFTHNKNKHRDS